MPEIYKDQKDKLKQYAKEHLNDPLAKMKEVNMDEEEKYNVWDETHRPFGLLSIICDPNIHGFANILANVNLRTTDGKVCLTYRFMYPDGRKSRYTATNTQDKSIWQNPIKTIEQTRLEFFKGFLKMADELMAIDVLEKARILEFTGKETDEELKNKLLKSDMFYMAEADEKTKQVRIINENA